MTISWINMKCILIFIPLILRLFYQQSLILRTAKYKLLLKNSLKLHKSFKINKLLKTYRYVYELNFIYFYPGEEKIIDILLLYGRSRFKVRMLWEQVLMILRSGFLV